MLYPLTFETIFKDKIWGGQKIKTILEKEFSPLPNCGETWEVSDVEGNVSVVKEGSLQGKSLHELVEQYKGKLVGQHVYEKYGNRFPLLIKFIDANDDLSIQVHPDDELAKKRQNGFGKTEMWYIMQADEGAKLNSGFNREVTKDEYVKAVADNTIQDILNIEPASPGDVFFLPAGRVHYIGKGLLLAEIQQTSDTTYRIYDFDRVDATTGQKRELHTDLAVDAINYHHYDQYKTQYDRKLNESVNAVTSDYFVTNVLTANQEIEHDYTHIDSFVILICVAGALTIEAEGGYSVSLKMGQCTLVPASINTVTFVPDGDMTLLETYVP
ncbi:type I phosphomannose isomerase catalytic subunit [Spirosoma endophyticum]|uniref:Mannose-6-phosphate isomerase, type 1 n=1 Tax=Spirosoma endophyticum TaxID=662367 RepID=A0A1I1RDT4_9BACT|nr:type I phosphomannose isomerase catalytic subunit [Spirosoma endophyticum]SFD30308.1 mannose-6-phosphate isomerase, type 1 [Spirosoma endophyticum]